MENNIKPINSNFTRKETILELFERIALRDYHFDNRKMGFFKDSRLYPRPLLDKEDIDNIIN